MPRFTHLAALLQQRINNILYFTAIFSRSTKKIVYSAQTQSSDSQSLAIHVILFNITAAKIMFISIRKFWTQRFKTQINIRKSNRRKPII